MTGYETARLACAVSIRFIRNVIGCTTFIFSELHTPIGYPKGGKRHE